MGGAPGAFHDRSTFMTLPDGTIRVRTGTQTNCGGFAEIHVRISRATEPGIAFWVKEGQPSGGRVRVTGREVPEHLRSAVFGGARDVYQQREEEMGLVFELLGAFVHPVDATQWRFQQAGQRALEGWLDSESPGA